MPNHHPSVPRIPFIPKGSNNLGSAGRAQPH